MTTDGPTLRAAFARYSTVHVYRVGKDHWIAAQGPDEAAALYRSVFGMTPVVEAVPAADMTTQTRFMEGADAAELTFADALAADLAEGEQPPFWFNAQGSTQAQPHHRPEVPSSSVT